ncbi:ribonuclease [Sphingomonas japonica]|uniref:Uncharacterized protein n=1 Tax=Sphingomonas japonica TaxID=511662 RepID=A0ABX0U1W8_9SPHN|nr:ribonuclease [Sphingomonas japonica]NIJ23704.1 hypothetical protein [Sphingomonas japonica]
MAEWLVETGIGEVRAALVEDGTIAQARIELPGLREGTVAEARLTEVVTPGAIGRVTLEGGEVALLQPLPRSLTQGAWVRVRVVREAIAERGAMRPPRVMVSDDAVGDGPDLLARIAATGIPVRTCLAHQPDALEAAGWSEVIEEARTGEIGFGGGALRMSVTPAMTLFDVDGPPPLEPLAVAAAGAVARAIVRLDIGGSIGIDFPTLSGKAARAAVAEAIDAALPLPFERTAMNGFGFMQVIRRRSRASLAELIQGDAVGAAARAALRAIERVSPPYLRPHIVPRAVALRIAARPDWLDELARRMGAVPVIEPEQER